jgi:hypothetical protein
MPGNDDGNQGFIQAVRFFQQFYTADARHLQVSQDNVHGADFPFYSLQGCLAPFFFKNFIAFSSQHHRQHLTNRSIIIDNQNAPLGGSIRLRLACSPPDSPAFCLRLFVFPLLSAGPTPHPHTVATGMFGGIEGPVGLCQQLLGVIRPLIAIPHGNPNGICEHQG